MTHFASTPRDATTITHDMDDITLDFRCLKVSALEKVSRINNSIRKVAISPSWVLFPDYNNEEYDNENVENKPDNSIIKEVKSPIKSTSPKASTRSGITFSIKKIRLENEQRRKEEVRQEMQRRLKSMEQYEIALQKQMALLRESMIAARERREKLKEDELARLEAEEEHRAQQSEIKRKHEQQLHAQRIKEQQEKLEREAEEQRRRNKERRILIERMLPLQANFRATYQDIGSISKSCKDRSIAGSAFTPYAARLKELSKCMEGLVEHGKMGDLTEADVSTAESLVKDSRDILDAFRLEIARINGAHDAEIARREEEVRQIQAQEQFAARRVEENDMYQSAPPVIERELHPSEYQPVQAHNLEQSSPAQVPDSQAQPNPAELAILEVSVKTELTADGLLKFYDRESLQLYLQSHSLVENHKALCSSVAGSGSTKFGFECRRAVNIPVNAISGVSGEHLTDKYERLHRLLAGKPPINANQHPQGIAWCKDMLANKFVNQGETLVSSKPELAFLYAAVAVALWSEYPDFGELLLAYFRKTCPYLVPLFIPQEEGQSNESYHKLLGYKCSDDGTLEEQHQFLKRISGWMRLYAALTVTKQRKNVTSPHPHGLQNAWRWLAAIMNIEPRPDVCATLILAMLEVAGNALWKTYPSQFPKLLTLLATQYYPKMQSMKSTVGGPLSRLEIFLTNCLSKGSIPPPHGQLPPNFW